MLKEVMKSSKEAVKRSKGVANILEGGHTFDFNKQEGEAGDPFMECSISNFDLDNCIDCFEQIEQAAKRFIVKEVG